MLKEPLLNEFEMQQSGVQKILEHFDARLMELRIKNDNPKADRLIRGRIAEVKTFNKLVTPTPHDEVPTSRNSMK